MKDVRSGKNGSNFTANNPGAFRRSKTIIKFSMASIVISLQASVVLAKGIPITVHADHDVGNSHIITDLVQLQSSEIRSYVIGRSFVPDEVSNPPHLRFVESFLAGGVWSSIRYERGPINHQGIWIIKRNEICVRESGQSEVCRLVYINRSTGVLAFNDIRNRLILNMKIISHY